jgi:hypothetical protein
MTIVGIFILINKKLALKAVFNKSCVHLQVLSIRHQLVLEIMKKQSMLMI